MATWDDIRKFVGATYTVREEWPEQHRIALNYEPTSVSHGIMVKLRPLGPDDHYVIAEAPIGYLGQDVDVIRALWCARHTAGGLVELEKGFVVLRDLRALTTVTNGQLAAMLQAMHNALVEYFGA
jgi:hypothetical protein